MELYVGMVLFALVFLASLISVEIGLSAAIIEITLGVLAGNYLGVERLDWVRDIAAFGGILLTISSTFGYQAGIIDQAQFSVLVATVVASAVVPTFVAQRFFHLHHALEAMGDEVEPELVVAPEPEGA